MRSQYPCHDSTGVRSFYTLVELTARDKKLAYGRICTNCLHGKHNCEEEESCPCVCNDIEFPLNKKA